MKHKLLFLLLLMQLTLSQAALADTVTINYITYETNDADMTASITGYTTAPTGDLVLPNTVSWIGGEYTVTLIEDNVFCYCTALTSIELPDGVTEIEMYAFNGCTSLGLVTFPNSLIEIGIGAFYNCSSLNSIKLPETLKYIGYNAFYNCTSLSNITFPQYNKFSVEIDAFYKCPNITSEYNISGYSFQVVNNMANLISYENTPFGECIIPDSFTIDGVDCYVTTINNKAFNSCEYITSVALPKYLMQLGYNVFSNCKAIESIELPQGLDSTGLGTFYGCTSLKSVTLPDGITTIGDFAFYDCTALDSIVLPESVSTIERYAFYNCTSIRKIKIESEIPIAIEDIIFGADTYNFDIYKIAALIVPNGCVNTYKSDEYWGQFETIISEEIYESEGIQSPQYIYLMGTITEWSFDDAYRLESANLDNIFIGEITVNNSDTKNSFRFCYYTEDEKWWESPYIGSSSLNSDTSIDINLTDNKYTDKVYYYSEGLFNFTERGVYELTVNLNDMTINIEKTEDIAPDDIAPDEPEIYSEIYLIGTPTGWNINSSAYTLTSENLDNIFTANFTFATGEDNYFRFYTSLGDWSTGSIGSAEDDGIFYNATMVDDIFTGDLFSGKGCYIIEDGFYKFTVNLNTMMLTIEPGSYATIYTVGNINGWSLDATATQGALTSITDDGIYTGTLILPDSGDGYSYFRFYEELDGDWSTGTIGTMGSDDEELIIDSYGTAFTFIMAGNEGSFKVPVGTYYFIVDLNESILVLELVSEGSVEGVEVDTTKVYTVDNMLMVSGAADGAAIKVYNLNGTVVANGLVLDSTTQIELPTASGIYIVTVGNQSYMIVK
ncbi:MAG: leucine-rich repeat protein [Bacteroidales bacterium]